MNDASSMLASFMESFPGLEQFLNLGVAMVGVILTGQAALKFIEIGKHGEQPGGVRWITPVMYLLAGTALFNFASSIDTALETITATPHRFTTCSRTVREAECHRSRNC